ncbi:PfkB family carbohydrate kinase [Roseomonas sp. CECT 9278]|uniref:PfkB family carbohydrate kinase n=1 Tax=Roseomonas sp. CECT 9278 TaxID=2845823 RepID=UPI001E5F7117|nr:PfkB family carbohydrate kinase [Roseomonas sp. CECT 9278]CAH0181944.1 Bifunctional ribokinase/ribose-5-phosphate isomerase A [Roseomonas sp. CECT 9278]
MGRIVVIGSYNRDTVLRVARLPQPGETMAAIGMARFHGGKGSNQAVAAARSGAQVAMVAAIGADAAGQGALDLWSAEGIDARRVARDGALPTGEAMILVDDAGENEIVVLAGANAALAAPPREAFDGAALVVAQLETPVATTEAAFAAARDMGATTLLNAAPAQALPANLVAATDILVVNETEAARLVAGAGAPAVLAAALAPRLRGGVVVTAGAAGAIWAGHDASPVTVPAPMVAVVDSTGAGDAFIGAFAAALAAGLDPAAAMRRGVVAGALACGKAGAVPSLPDLAGILAAGG